MRLEIRFMEHMFQKPDYTELAHFIRKIFVGIGYLSCSHTILTDHTIISHCHAFLFLLFIDTTAMLCSLQESISWMDYHETQLSRKGRHLGLLWHMSEPHKVLQKQNNIVFLHPAWPYDLANANINQVVLELVSGKDELCRYAVVLCFDCKEHSDEGGPLTECVGGHYFGLIWTFGRLEPLRIFFF